MAVHIDRHFRLVMMGLVMMGLVMMGLVMMQRRGDTGDQPEQHQRGGDWRLP